MCANRGSEVRQPPGGHDLESKSEPSAHISTPSGLVPAQSVLAQGFGGRTPKTQPEPTPLQPAPLRAAAAAKMRRSKSKRPLGDRVHSHRITEERAHQANPVYDRDPAAVAGAASDPALPDAKASSQRRLPGAEQVRRSGDPQGGVREPVLHHVLQ